MCASIAAAAVEIPHGQLDAPKISVRTESVHEVCRRHECHHVPPAARIGEGMLHCDDDDCGTRPPLQGAPIQLHLHIVDLSAATVEPG